MNNRIIQNLFTKEEVLLLKNIIDQQTSVLKLDEPQLGRTRYDLDDLPHEVMIKVNKIAHDINIDLEFSFAYYVEYSLKYGEPCLPVHTDLVHSKLVIDYQLDSNMDWSIYVDGNQFKLKDNESLTINVNSQAHWRPQRKFKDEESLKMVFFHFIDKTDPTPRILSREEVFAIQKKWDHLWNIWEKD
jgi:uncharacterized protein YacL (UPF0231 family)